MIDALMENALEYGIPASAPASDVVQYYAQVGDFIGGVWGTSIGVITLIVIALTWRSTHIINKQSKEYQIFSEILRSHEEIVGSIRLGKFGGRDAFGVILSEFYEAYEAVCIVNDNGGVLSIANRIDIAFTVIYYGAHPEIIKVINGKYLMLDGGKIGKILNNKKKSNKINKVNKEISDHLNGNPIDNTLWHDRLHDAIKISNSLDIPFEQKRILRDVLVFAQHLPRKKINSKKLFRAIEDIDLSNEFGGHQNILSNYFRNLYSAYTFIQDSSLSSVERHALAKVLRSKLSNYEQALLALNSLSTQGSAWINSGIIDEYAPIKNIPEHFFSFDDDFSLTLLFPNVLFEWQKRGR